MFPRCAVLAAATLLLGCDSTTAPPPRTVLDFDFRTDPSGWRAAFSDYPQGREADVEFVAGERDLPAPLDPGRALYHRGVNISDDLFMYFDRPVEGLEPGAEYRAWFRVEFASAHGQGCAFGVGSSVFLKAGASGVELAGGVDDQGVIRLNVDKGEQQNGGANAVLLGDIRNGAPGCEPDAPFAAAAREVPGASITVAAGGTGRLWLFFGSESAFESEHELYFTRLRVELERVEAGPIGPYPSPGPGPPAPGPAPPRWGR